MIEQYLSYLQHVRRLSANTVRLRRIYIGQLAAEHDVRTVSASQLRTWIAARPDWSSETVNVATSTFRSFFKWAHETSARADDPARSLRPVRVMHKKARIASPAHIEAGLSSTAAVQALTMLGAECGLRVHEMAKLHTRDRDGAWLTIVGKGSHTRYVECSPELLDVLEQMESVQGTGYYFRTKTGGHVSADAMRARITRALGTNPHSLRHRAGTTVYRGTGNNLRVTQVFLGHRSANTTAIYVHVERDDLSVASAAARLAA